MTDSQVDALCGPSGAWNATPSAQSGDQASGFVTVHNLTAHDSPGALFDMEGHARHRLGLDAAGTAQFLTRPDGHVAVRAGGTDLAGLQRYLNRWLSGPPPGSGS